MFASNSESVQQSIDAVREAMALPTAGNERRFAMNSAILLLFHDARFIAEDLESLRAVLALATEVESLRGPGVQSAARTYARGLEFVAVEMTMQLIDPDSGPEDDDPPERPAENPAPESLAGLELLTAHAFSRIKGRVARSQVAGESRASAWHILAGAAGILRRPEHLARALEVAANRRSPRMEREAALEFLTAYWRDETPDEATICLLQELTDDPSDREFLVAALQTQIEMGLGSEFGALDVLGKWDDEHGRY